jgi:hypothetical protein
VLFSDVQDAMKAENVLKKAAYAVKLVAPPPELRRGCDLALEVNLVEQPGIEKALKERDAAYVAVVPSKVGAPELLEVVTVTDFDKWVMAKAGNMKLTFDKESGVIVNVSGGGCPDIPYLHAALAGRKLTEAPRPRDTGFTLCAQMLDRALEECLTLWQEGG